MHFKVETIDPKKAEKYLSSNYDHQRHVKPAKVNRLALMMEEGSFDGENGEDIKFAKDGKADILIDGQHRLMAIIKSNTTQKIGVKRGVSKEAFLTVDQGDPRTVENFYQIYHQNNPKVSSVVGKWLYYTKTGGTPLTWKGSGAAPLPGLVAKWALDTYPDIPQAIDELGDLLTKFQKKGLGTKNHLAFCYYCWRHHEPLLAYEIAKFLAVGEGSVPQTIHALREWLLEQSRDNSSRPLPGTARGVQVVNALNTAWEAIHSGKNNIRAFGRLVSKFERQIKASRQAANIKPKLILIDD